jgi:hypothetical protein
MNLDAMWYILSNLDIRFLLDIRLRRLPAKRK